MVRFLHARLLKCLIVISSLFLCFFSSDVTAREDPDLLTRGDFIEMMVTEHPDSPLVTEDMLPLHGEELYKKCVEEMRRKGIRYLPLTDHAFKEPLSRREFVNLTYSFITGKGDTSYIENKFFLKDAGIINPADIGLVTSYEGEVLKYSAGSDEAQEIRGAEPVLYKDITETEEDSKIEMEFDDLSVLTIGEDTRIEINKLVYDPEKKTRDVLLTLHKGTLRSKVHKTPGVHTNFSVKTATAVIGVRGTEFVVSVNKRGETKVITLEGLVGVRPLTPQKSRKADTAEKKEGTGSGGSESSETESTTTSGGESSASGTEETSSANASATEGGGSSASAATETGGESSAAPAGSGSTGGGTSSASSSADGSSGTGSGTAGAPPPAGTETTVAPGNNTGGSSPSGAQTDSTTGTGMPRGGGTTATAPPPINLSQPAANEVLVQPNTSVSVSADFVPSKPVILTVAQTKKIRTATKVLNPASNLKGGGVTKKEAKKVISKPAFNKVIKKSTIAKKKKKGGREEEGDDGGEGENRGEGDGEDNGGDTEEATGKSKENSASDAEAEQGDNAKKKSEVKKGEDDNGNNDKKGEKPSSEPLFSGEKKGGEGFAESSVSSSSDNKPENKKEKIDLNQLQRGEETSIAITTLNTAAVDAALALSGIDFQNAWYALTTPQKESAYQRLNDAQLPFVFERLDGTLLLSSWNALTTAQHAVLLGNLTPAQQVYLLNSFDTVTFSQNWAYLNRAGQDALLASLNLNHLVTALNTLSPAQIYASWSLLPPATQSAVFTQISDTLLPSILNNDTTAGFNQHWLLLTAQRQNILFPSLSSANILTVLSANTGAAFSGFWNLLSQAQQNTALPNLSSGNILTVLSANTGAAFSGFWNLLSQAQKDAALPGLPTAQVVTVLNALTGTPLINAWNLLSPAQQLAGKTGLSATVVSSLIENYAAAMNRLPHTLSSTTNLRTFWKTLSNTQKAEYVLQQDGIFPTLSAAGQAGAVATLAPYFSSLITSPSLSDTLIVEMKLTLGLQDFIASGESYIPFWDTTSITEQLDYQTRMSTVYDTYYSPAQMDSLFLKSLLQDTTAYNLLTAADKAAYSTNVAGLNVPLWNSLTAAQKRLFTQILFTSNKENNVLLFLNSLSAAQGQALLPGNFIASLQQDNATLFNSLLQKGGGLLFSSAAYTLDSDNDGLVNNQDPAPFNAAISQNFSSFYGGKGAAVIQADIDSLTPATEPVLIDSADIANAIVSDMAGTPAGGGTPTAATDINSGFLPQNYALQTGTVATNSYSETLNRSAFLSYAVQVEEDQLNREALTIMQNNASATAALKSQISASLTSQGIRQRDALLVQQADAQAGRVLRDAQGNWVRTQQYVIRPSANSVEVVSVTKRRLSAGSDGGLNVLDWKTDINFVGGATSLPVNLLSLPWADWLTNVTTTAAPGTGTLTRSVVSPNGLYDVASMSVTVKGQNPSATPGAAATFSQLTESRTFGASYVDAAAVRRQDITSQTLSNNVIGNLNLNLNNAPAAGEYSVIPALNAAGGNVSAFDYRMNTGGVLQSINVQLTPLANPVGSGIANNVALSAYPDMWSALSTNLVPANAATSSYNINNNNLEIRLSSSAGGNALASPIDFIYIPLTNMVWK